MFFQNLFDQEFQGYLVLGDRQASITFKIPANKNPQTKQIAWNSGPYDLSSLNTLTLNYSWDRDFKIWSSVQVNIAGVDPSQTRAAEIASILNANPIFSELLVASVTELNSTDTVVVSKNNSKKQDIKIYFDNSSAESVLKFNKYASVADLPSYFERHTIENRSNYPDSLGMLTKLDVSNPVDEAVADNAGFTVPAKEDYELLRGRSGLFTFQNITVDGSDRITQIIEHPAGAMAGDFARKINYTYSGSNINPSKVTEIPYVLADGDLVTP